MEVEQEVDQVELKQVELLPLTEQEEQEQVMLLVDPQQEQQPLLLDDGQQLLLQEQPLDPLMEQEQQVMEQEQQQQVMEQQQHVMEQEQEHQQQQVVELVRRKRCGVKNLPCHLCSKAFSTRSNINHHLRTKHGVDTTTIATEGNYQFECIHEECKASDVRFHTAHYYRQHLEKQHAVIGISTPIQLTFDTFEGGSLHCVRAWHRFYFFIRPIAN